LPIEEFQYTVLSIIVEAGHHIWSRQGNSSFLSNNHLQSSD